MRGLTSDESNCKGTTLTTPTLFLGKMPAREGAVRLKLSDYLDHSVVLPKIPPVFGHQAAVNGQWGMLGNDTHANCVFAGGAHEHLVLNAENGRTVRFSDESVLSDYSAVTGWNPADPDSDAGTDVATALAYRRRVGLLDADGNRHKIAAYLALEPGDLVELYAAAYLCSAVAVGYELPTSAIDQFNRGEPWTVKRGSKIAGGHYVPAFGRTNPAGNFGSASWARDVTITPPFYGRYNDETYAIVSQEELDGKGRTPEAIDWATLRADLPALSQLG